MTFREIELALPHGFHDALFLGVRFDPVLQVVSLDVSVNSGNALGESYRSMSLVATGVVFFFIEPPSPAYPYALDGGPLQASGDGQLLGLNAQTEELVKQLPDGVDHFRFFFESWNSFLYVAAENVTYNWMAS